MTFHELLQDLLSDTNTSLRSFFPELVLCLTIVLMLLARVLNLSKRISGFLLALIGSALALYLAALPGHGMLAHVFGWLPWGIGEHLRDLKPPADGGEIFTGLLIYDKFTAFFRTILLLFAVLFVLFTRLSGIPDREDGEDFYTLVLGATLGMCLMASANHLLMVFLAVEMASVPSYALAGLLKGRRQSSEAALKYAVFGAGAAGVMLYGISLVAGAAGSAHIPTIAVRLATMAESGAINGYSTVLVLGGLMIAVGLAFKLSAVPFHFWCPDVFEGAAAEVNAFLSVASKAAALALLVRIVVGFGHVPGDRPSALAAAPAAKSAVAEPATDARPAVKPDTTARLDIALSGVRGYIWRLVSLLAAITCTFGNLAAYGQTNIKRLLAYSTIAHAGYLMLPVAAAGVLMGAHPDQAEQAIASLCFYICTYLFMNLGAFAVVAFLRNAIRSEEIADYAGLIRRAPGLVILFSMMLLSLLGLPPLAGFAAKVLIFGSLANAAKLEPSASLEMYLLFLIGGINTLLSLFYYLRVVKVMVLDPEPDDRLPLDFPLASLNGLYLTLIALPVLVLGIWFNELIESTRDIVSRLLG